MKICFFGLVGLYLLLGLPGCREESAPAGISPDQITERRDFVTVKKKRALGASCDDTGKDGCEGGVCLKVGADRLTGSICTQGCKPSGSCPDGYACTQVYPTDDAWFCSPQQVAGADGGAP
jgi:hypothetical protein